MVFATNHFFSLKWLLGPVKSQNNSLGTEDLKLSSGTDQNLISLIFMYIFKAVRFKLLDKVIFVVYERLFGQKMSWLDSCQQIIFLWLRHFRNTPGSSKFSGVGIQKGYISIILRTVWSHWKEINIKKWLFCPKLEP